MSESPDHCDGSKTLRIESLVAGGLGLARELAGGAPDPVPGGRGRVVLVPATAPGDLVRVSVEPSSLGLARGVVLEVLEHGPGRRAPPCPDAGTCGGCDWQHLDDAAQDAAVRGILVESLRRIGKLRDFEASVAATIGPPERFAYRSRARLHLATWTEPARLGFMAAGTNDVVEPKACLVLEPELEAIRQRLVEIRGDLAKLLRGSEVELQLDMPSPSRGTALLRTIGGNVPEGRLRFALDAIASAAPELVALAGIAEEESCDPRRRKRLASGRAARFHVARGERRVAYRRGPLEDPEGYAAFHSPGGFLQAGRAGNRLLVSRVLAAVRALELSAGARVLELFAGSGNLSLPLASLGLAVAACDADSRSVEDGRRAASAMRRELAVPPTFETCEAAKWARAQAGTGVDLVVLDPPRTGAAAACEAIAALRPAFIVYVSCDAPTLARDVATLARNGFALERAEPLALFPQSSHFETIATLARR